MFYLIDISLYFFLISAYIRLYTILSFVEFIILEYINDNKRVNTILFRKILIRLKKIKKILSL